MKIIVVLLIMGCVSVTAFCKKPYLKRGQPASSKNWVLFFNDEFRKNSTIDNKWISQNASPEHIQSSRWRENLSIRNGKLRIKNRSEKRGGKDWTTGCMTNQINTGYGYYECRMKISGAEGINNSFWLYTSRKPGYHTFEIDFFEIHYPNKIHYTLHDYGVDSSSKIQTIAESFSPDVDLSKSYHIYGVDWNEKTIDFYFDGALKWSVKNDMCKNIGTMVLSTAVLSWAGNRTGAIDNTMMLVDYVRYWISY